MEYSLYRVIGGTNVKQSFNESISNLADMGSYFVSRLTKCFPLILQLCATPFLTTTIVRAGEKCTTARGPRSMACQSDTVSGLPTAAAKATKMLLRPARIVRKLAVPSEEVSFYCKLRWKT